MKALSLLAASVSSTASEAASGSGGSSGLQAFFEDVGKRFYNTFIVEDRWRDFLDGLKITVQITVFAALLGIAIGFLVAMVRSTYDLTLQKKKCKNIGDVFLKIINAICSLYITVIRGTPVVIQILIMANIVFASWRANQSNMIIIAILSFGINSGAYVAEIVRSGIMSIDKGQFEASRSIGFNYTRTMVYVIMPQAIKNILPALGNEFIVLVKETSVAGYIAIMDLTRVGESVISKSYDAYFPLISVAVFYLIIVLIFQFFLRKLERRLRKRDH